MTLAQTFAEYLENLGYGIFEQDIFIGLAPSSNKVPDAIFWIIATGGSITSETTTGERMKQYTVDIFYRDTNYQTVYETLESLEHELNCTGCVELEDIDVVDISATNFMVDEDLDSEDRKVGLLQLTLTVFASCIIVIS